MLATDLPVDPRGTADAALSIRLLGEFSLHRGGQRLPRITLRKSQYLLAYLVLHPDRDLDRDLLAGTFWPDVDRVTAGKSLRTALVSIRDLLEPRGEDKGQVLHRCPRIRTGRQGGSPRGARSRGAPPATGSRRRSLPGGAAAGLL
jgi:hypothetical protein